MNKKILLALILVISFGLGGYFLMMPEKVDQLGPTFGAANAEIINEIDTSVIREMTLGINDAPIKVVEYASFTCPHCRSFHDNVFKKLKTNYIDSNKISFTYREIYFDRFGLWASIIARCGAQNKFFAISDLLYKKQSEWTKGSPADIADSLRRVGVVSGLAQNDVEACFKDGQKAQSLVAWSEKNSKKDEITSTPSFIINGKKYANLSYLEFKQILDSE